MEFILNAIACACVAVITHELGHYFAALILGMRPKLHIEISPYVSWTDVSDTRTRIAAIAGFGTEGVAGLLIFLLVGTAGTWITYNTSLCYFGVFVGHLCAYPFTAKGKQSNDFRWLA